MLAGVTDIALRVVDGVVQVFTTTRAGGGILALRLDQTDDGLTLIDQQGLAASNVLSAPGRLAVLDNGVLASFGGWASRPIGYALDDRGMIGAERGFANGPSGVVVAQAFSGGTVVLAMKDSAFVEVWQIADNGSMSRRSVTQLTDPATLGVTIADLQIVTIGSRSFVLSLSTAAETVTVAELSSDGRLSVISQVGAPAGLGISAPSALEVVQTGGNTWVFLAGGGSSSISVLLLGSNGRIRLTDHIVDTLDTRFQSVQAMATVVVGDRVFVFAGGNDEGLSAFMLLPDGKLVSVAQQLLTDRMPLDNISAIEAVLVNGRIEVIIGTEGSGVLRLSLDPGTLARQQVGRQDNDRLIGGGNNDLLAGGAGNDTLQGGAGDDILVDGTGRDEMTGGSGADLFVLLADGEADTIRDFTPGQDRLDLSNWGRVYSIEVVESLERPDMLILRWNDEIVYIYSSSGRPLPSETFTSSDLFGLWHVVAPPVNPGLRLLGTTGNDTLEGGAGADTFVGGSGGRDVIRGGGGFDLVDYGAVQAPVLADLNTQAATAGSIVQDRLEGIEGLAGGRLDDTLRGDGGGNRLLGRGGLDVLIGRKGADTLDGGEANDTLDGGSGADLMIGGQGIDTVTWAEARSAVRIDLASGSFRGAAKGDRLDGVEVLVGSRFGDRIAGTDRADVFVGGSGNDRLEGRSGNDSLSGGAGSDTLIGGLGDDTLNGGSGLKDWVWYDGLPAVSITLGTKAVQTTGGAGRDIITGIENARGGDGNDRLSGNKRANILQGGAGDDTLAGQRGNDTLRGGQGNDRLAGGTGYDVADYRDARANLQIDLAKQGGQQTGHGRDTLIGIEALLGGSGNDRLLGNAGNNRLSGNSGADQLFGRNGNDTLSGGSARDRLVGGVGDDVLTGGSGGDVFVFGSGRDTIRDASRAEGDRVHLDLSDLGLGSNTTVSSVITRFARDTGADVVLDFGNQGRLLLEDVPNLDALRAMLVLI
ncbi:calcium-binding protein [Gemmobacter denitrificans]|uniref:Calcium-binding protein n=1 Tax=Gemmobacter denitrificans TaxID=3123040 RepID=A0ABU8BUI5_9RHOB